MEEAIEENSCVDEDVEGNSYVDKDIEGNIYVDKDFEGNYDEDEDPNEDEDVKSNTNEDADSVNVPSNVIAINPFSGAFISRRIKRKEYLKNCVRNSAGLSQQTAIMYENTWKGFTSFANTSEEPTKEDYVKYFRHLREAKNHKASSLWGMCSRLKSSHKSKYSANSVGNFGEIFGTICDMIREYEKGETKTKSEFKVFTKEQGGDSIEEKNA